MVPFLPMLVSFAGLGSATAGPQESTPDAVDPITSRLGDDRIVLDDGRILAGTVLLRDGQRFLKLPHGTVPVPDERVREVFLDPGEAYVPRTPREAKRLEEGFVYFENHWMHRAARERIIETRRREREERLAEIRAHDSIEAGWLQTTAHFRVRSNTSAERLEEYAALLERMVDEFSKSWKLTFDGTRFEVRIHRDRGGYHADGGPPTTSGSFHQLSKTLRLYHDRSDPDFTREVLQHEATHLLFGLVAPDFLYPVWLSEGLAEYYATAQTTPRGMAFGAPQEGRLVVLRRDLESGGRLDLEALTMTDASRFSGLDYARAWSLIHFVQTTEPRRFRTFLRRLVSGRGLDLRSTEVAGKPFRTVRPEDGHAWFVKLLGIRSIEAFEAAWTEHVNETLPEPGPRGWVVAAKLYYQTREVDLAIAAAERAIQLGSRDPTASLTMARSHRLLEQWEEVAAAFRACVALDPLNPDPYHEWGVSLLRGEGASDALRAEARDRLYLAAELEPTEPRYRRALRTLLDEPPPR